MKIKRRNYPLLVIIFREFQRILRLVVNEHFWSFFHSNVKLSTLQKKNLKANLIFLKVVMPDVKDSAWGGRLKLNYLLKGMKNSCFLPCQTFLEYPHRHSFASSSSLRIFSFFSLNENRSAQRKSFPLLPESCLSYNVINFNNLVIFQLRTLKMATRVK